MIRYPARRMSRSPAWVPVAGFCLLLAVFVLRLLGASASNTLTLDEPLYVGPGLVLWEKGGYDFAADLSLHPPLAYHIAALPLLAFDLDDVPREQGIARRIFQREEPSTRTLRTVVRLPFIALACWGALLCLQTNSCPMYDLWHKRGCVMAWCCVH